jgi:hypothetical protein
LCDQGFVSEPIGSFSDVIRCGIRPIGIRQKPSRIRSVVCGRRRIPMWSDIGFDLFLIGSAGRIGSPGAIIHYFTQTLITTLKLHKNQIGDQGAQYLANALRENKVLSLLPAHSITYSLLHIGTHHTYPRIEWNRWRWKAACQENNEKWSGSKRKFLILTKTNDCV